MEGGSCQATARLNSNKMALNTEQIAEKILKRDKAGAINTARAQEARIRFHAEIQPNINKLGEPYGKFKSWVRSLIPADKYKIFEQLFKAPVMTNEVCSAIFDKLSKIFDGRNAAFNYQFNNAEQRDDWEWYRQEHLNEPAVWRTTGWEYFKTAINSILIVDVPRLQSTLYPEPYFYWLSIKKVTNYGLKASSKGFAQLDWIIFKDQENNFAVFDDTSYRVFANRNETIGALISERLHDLGYCPARFFWNTPLSVELPDIKKSPLSIVLNALDWYLFFQTSKQHLDLYAPYPIYSGYEQRCDFSNAENGQRCNGGYLVNAGGGYVMDGNGLVCCPKCGDKRIAGVGSFVEVKAPRTKEDPDLRNPVQILTVDRSSLDYNREEKNKLREEIITACIGIDSEILSEQAVNELQVELTFQSQNTILQETKSNFEDAQTWVDTTICKLRYGNTFVQANVNWGTEFYTQNADTLRSRYALAKQSGATEAELDAIRDQILETEYRTNPIQMQRMQILSHLEPLRHVTRSEAMELAQRNLISPTDLLIKFNFATFVQRFERENINIIDFAEQLPFETKIKLISETLRSYAEQNTQ